MNDPRVLSLICVVFALLGSYNLYNGSRRIRDARRSGKPLRWYKQINFLTGIEYIILTFVFLLSMANQQGTLNPGLRGLLVPLYFILLLAAAGIAGMVIRQGILNTRASRANQQSSVPGQSTQSAPPAKQRHDELSQRQRERRKKAAAARRRKAGRA